MVSRVTSHLSVPLLRNGYALAGNTVLTAGLGAVYWVLAARLFSAEIVGVGSALIAAMTFLTSLTQLNLNNALNRFIPSAGASTAALLLGSYAVAVPLSGIAAVVFLLGLDLWASGLDVIVSSGAASASFVLATMVWTLFVLQDAALAGLRRATWIPVENGVYGIAKIALLALFAGATTGLAIFASWTLPLVALIIPVNWLIFRKAIPEHVAASEGATVGFDARAVARFAGADYVASLMWMATTSLLPIVVLEVAGAEANAYFYLAWTIAYTLYLVARSTGVSLITEGALEPAKLMAYGRRVLLQTGSLIVPAVAVILLVAPLLLRIFGPDYAAEGSTLLRLLALSAIPNIVVTLYVSIARVERRMRAILVLYTILGVLVLGLSAFLLPTLGIDGVGWAWLITESMLAVVLLLTVMRSMWVPWMLEHPITQRLAAALPGGRSEDVAAAAAHLLPALTAALDREPPLAPGPWRVTEYLPTELEVVVVALESGVGERNAVAKIALDPTASTALRAEADALADLRSTAALGGWVELTPLLLARGTLDGRAYFVEEHLAGSDARDHLTSPEGADRLLRAAAAAIDPLHRNTQQLRKIDESALVHWVDDPLADLDRLLSGGGRRRSERLVSLRSELRGRLEGRRVAESQIHGDYWLGNVLVTEALGVSGIVDWGQTERGLPQLDFGHLLLTTRVAMRRRQFGRVAVDLLAEPDWSESERDVLAMTPPLSDDPVEAVRLLVLLTWLRHTASNVRKSERYRTSWLWMARNVDEVLAAL